MRVKSVTHEYDPVSRYIIEFEHNGVTWVKYLSAFFQIEQLESCLNSVIEDTVARTR